MPRNMDSKQRAFQGRMRCWVCVMILLVGSVTSHRSNDPGPCGLGVETPPRCEVRLKGQVVTCSGGLRAGGRTTRSPSGRLADLQEPTDPGLRTAVASGVGSMLARSKVRELTLCRWPDEFFDPEKVVSLFPTLKKLALIDSNVSYIISDFPRSFQQLETVNMSGLLLERIAPTAFSQLSSLKVLDLRNNRLREMEGETLARSPLLERAYLTGNKWDCSEDLTWLADNSANNSVARRVVDRDKMNCSGSPYPGKPVVPVMNYIKTLQQECPSDPPNNCTCKMSNIVRGPGYLIPVITVDCNERGLTELPDTLPTNTTTLLVKGNKIWNLKPLASNPHYAGVVDVYLDDNAVESVAVLEGADWLANFRVLSLRGNRLSELPTYALDNALMHNAQAVNIFLGDNPWRCDCTFTPDFQELLVKYLILVKDIYAIKCSYVEDDENSLMEIRALSRSAICREPSGYLIRPLHLVNGVLASLIVLVVGKLCYDYWSFRRTGRLPWIVAKMP